LQGHSEILIILLQHGANVHCLDKDGDNPLHDAAGSGHIEILSILLKHGADVQCLNNNRNSPLHLAAGQGHSEILTILLQYGADVHCLNKKGNSPLHFAAYQGHSEILTILLHSGADVHCLSKDGYSPLHLAAGKGDSEILTIFLQNGADVHCLNKDGNSPLHLAAILGHIEILTILLQHGADVHCLDNDWDTPLHLAARQGHSEILTILLQHGADVHCLSKDGNSPLHLAVQQGHSEILTILLQHGADVHYLNKEGSSSLHLAAFKGNSDILEIILNHDPKLLVLVNPRTGWYPLQGFISACIHTETLGRNVESFAKLLDHGVKLTHLMGGGSGKCEESHTVQVERPALPKLNSMIRCLVPELQLNEINKILKLLMMNQPLETHKCATADYSTVIRQLPVYSTSDMQDSENWINRRNDGKASLLLPVMRKKLDAVLKLMFRLVQEHYLGWTALKLISKEWLITEDEATRVDLIRIIGKLVKQGRLFCLCVWGRGGESVLYYYKVKNLGFVSVFVLHHSL
jgi:ankyrin repeat protein